MILLVDDDPAILDGTRTVLELAGFEVLTASGAAAALEILALGEPELIIADVMMPGMDGFAFKAAADAGWPNRLTPFLFLSSLTDPKDVIRGLEAGAWDYLAKPFHPAVLTAKVRGILAARSRFAIPSFRGDLLGLPLAHLLDFTLKMEINGELEIDGAAGDHAIVPLLRGRVPEEDRSSLERRFPEGAPGRFVLRVPPPDWSQLAAPERAPVPTAPKPMGKLSGVRLGKRFLSIQTEAVNQPRDQVVTIVFLDGKVMQKRVTEASAHDAAGMERQIEEQHSAVEGELMAKAAALAKGREDAVSSGAASPPDTPSVLAETDEAAFGRLLGAGFDSYRDGDLTGALDAWKEAERLKPGDEGS